MKRDVGLWIDHKKAVIVTVSNEGEQTREIASNVGKRVRFSGDLRSKSPGGHQAISAEDTEDRRYMDDLNDYYDEVISSIRDAEAILILGPGEAKGELAKRLESSELGGRIVGIETADKMTDRQIAAKVRERFKG